MNRARRGRKMKPSVPFELSITATTGKEYVSFLRKHLPAAHALLRPALADMSLALVGDARMSALHVQFMGIAGPTDVLTFPLDLDHRGRPVSGEAIVCVPEARRQARARGTRVQRELLLYALHGMLHLAGFDDRTKSAFQKMHRMEDDILTRLGLGPVFAPPIAPPATASRRRRNGSAPRRVRLKSGD